ncbi:MAG: hypothetical protein ABW096_12810 [Candidatus Thiodiazotropha sp.]
MAVASDDCSLRFIQITLGEVGISRDQVSIDGFTETDAADDARHFLKSWREFDRCGDNRRSTEEQG